MTGGLAAVIFVAVMGLLTGAGLWAARRRAAERARMAVEDGLIPITLAELTGALEGSWRRHVVGGGWDWIGERGGVWLSLKEPGYDIEACLSCELALDWTLRGAEPESTDVLEGQQDMPALTDWTVREGVGDAAFDEMVEVAGDGALPFLNADVRRLATRLVGGSNRFEGGRLFMSVSETPLGGVAAAIAALEEGRELVVELKRLAGRPVDERLSELALEDPASGIRKSAMGMLQARGAIELLDLALRHHLGGSDPRLRVWCAKRLKGEEAAVTLREAALSDRAATSLRVEATQALAGKPSAETDACLVELCGGLEPVVAGAALRVLAGRTPVGAAAAAIRMLERHEPALAPAAIEVLRVAGGRDAVVALRVVEEAGWANDLWTEIVEAVGQIQARLRGAEAGQLALVEEGAVGALSEVGGADGGLSEVGSG